MKQRYRYKIIDEMSEIIFASDWIESSTKISTSMLNGDGYCLDVSNIEVIALEEGIEIVIHQGGKTINIYKTEQ